MSDSLRESLSALLDNEADELELRRVLKSAQADPELLQTWRRYSTVQAALRDGALGVSPDFAERVRARIEAEPLARPRAVAAWQQSLAKFAIAASVAAVFFVALQVGLTPGNDTPPLVVDNEATAPATPDATLVADSDVADVQQIAPRVREYIDGIYIDVEQPPRTEHLQDSPLYRLVNVIEDQQ